MAKKNQVTADLRISADAQLKNSRNFIRDMKITCWVYGDDVYYNVDTDYYSKEYSQLSAFEREFILRCRT